VFTAVGASLLGHGSEGVTNGSGDGGLVSDGFTGSGGSGASGAGRVTSGGSGSTPAKRVGLVFELSPRVLCLGLMTSAKFCTRVLFDGVATCGVAAHVRKFQRPPSSAFLKDTEVRALCAPVLDLSVMSPSQRLRIQAVQLMAAEWGALFQQVQQKKPPKWLSFDDSPAATVDTSAMMTAFEILSPTNVASDGLLSVIPMLSFDKSTASGEEISEEMDMADVSSFIKRFRAHFSSLKSK